MSSFHHCECVCVCVFTYTLCCFVFYFHSISPNSISSEFYSAIFVVPSVLASWHWSISACVVVCTRDVATQSRKLITIPKSTIIILIWFEVVNVFLLYAESTIWVVYWCVRVCACVIFSFHYCFCCCCWCCAFIFIHILCSLSDSIMILTMYHLWLCHKRESLNCCVSSASRLSITNGEVTWLLPEKQEKVIAGAHIHPVRLDSHRIRNCSIFV